MKSNEVEIESQIMSGSKNSNFLNWFNPTFSGIGFKAWLLQRLTGIFLVIYLFFHFGVIGTLVLDSSGELYNTLTRTMNSPLIHLDGILAKSTSLGFIVDVGLIGVLVYHGLNGFRIILFDLVIGIRSQKVIFWILFIIGLAIWFLGVYFILILPEIVL